MTKTDWTVTALNAAMLLVAVVGLASQDRDPMTVALMVSVVTAMINGAWVIRRGSGQARTRDAATPSGSGPIDELDARAVLDLDARLDALEQAQTDAVDAARWRALVESGQVTGPAADGPGALASSAGAALRNGQ